MKRWKEYFQEVLEGNSQPLQEQTLEDSSGREENEISLDEMSEAIKELRNGKAAGNEDISPEAIKSLDTIGEEFMHKIIQKFGKRREYQTTGK